MRGNGEESNEDTGLESCTSVEDAFLADTLPTSKKRKKENITVSKAAEKAVALRECITKASLRDPDKMLPLVEALERQPVSLQLLERMGISTLLQARI